MQGSASTPVVRPGETVTFDFRTDRPIAPNAGGEIRYSDTCQPGSDQIGRATGPPAAPPKPKLKPPRCQCKSLTIDQAVFKRFKPAVFNRRQVLPLRLGLNLRWKIRCSPNKGQGGCEGKIEVSPPVKKKAVRLFVPKGKELCKGNCKRSKAGTMRLVMNFHLGLNPLRELQGESYRFGLKKFCKRAGDYVLVGTQSTTIAFDERGHFDPVQSDLNANGIPDGDE
jgi:hypothetical protein